MVLKLLVSFRASISIWIKKKIFRKILDFWKQNNLTNAPQY